MSLRTARLLGAALVTFALIPAGSAPAATHVVAPGETLWGIAQNNGVSASALAAANGLSRETRVVAGTSLTIPAAGAGAGTQASATGSSATGSTATASAPSSGGLTVRLGDNLSSLAARNGVSLSRLAAANRLDPSRPLLAGTRLHLPAAGGAGASAAPAAMTSSAPAALGGYTVRPGDTLSDLAARSRVPVAQRSIELGVARLEQQAP